MPACNGSESSGLFYLILAWLVELLLLTFLSLVLAMPNCQCHASSTWNPPASQHISNGFANWFMYYAANPFYLLKDSKVITLGGKCHITLHLKLQGGSEHTSIHLDDTATASFLVLVTVPFPALCVSSYSVGSCHPPSVLQKIKQDTWGGFNQSVIRWVKVVEVCCGW